MYILAANRFTRVLSGALFLALLLFFSGKAVALAEESGLPEFDGTGYIDRIAFSEVVINDSLYSIASGAGCYNKKGEIVGSGYFGKGQYVGFTVAAGGKKVVTALWMLDAPLKK